MITKTLLLSLLAVPALACAEDGFVSIFNGKDLSGWKVNTEHPESVSVKDGELVIAGERTHAFYDGEVGKHNFKNFELKAKVMTKPGANSGIYFHTEYQADGWPSKGYECQVNNTHSDPKKTGGLYAIKDNFEEVAKDNEWFDYYIKVEGKQITIKINGRTVSEFTEPEGWTPPQGMEGRKLSSGTLAIQAHDPKSVVHFKDIMLKVND
jgi:hypothetical protein